MDQVPVGHAAVLRRILAHGRDHDPVAEILIANAQGREQSGLGHLSLLRTSKYFASFLPHVMAGLRAGRDRTGLLI
jgi:hypothetical protein